MINSLALTPDLAIMKQARMVTIVACVTILSCLASATTSQNDLNSALTNVEKSLKDAPGDSKGAMAALMALKKDLHINSKNADKAKSILGTVNSALGKLKSKNTAQIISGCLDIVGGIASTFGGPVGMGIGAVASFVSAILGLFTGKAAKTSIASVIDSALKNHRDDALERAGAGAKRDFAESCAFIKTLKAQTDLSKTDLTILAANVPIYKFSQLLGVLESRILRGAVTTDFSEAKRTLDLVLLYSQLAVMRETILIELSLLYRKPGTANYIADAVDNANKVNKDFAKDTLTFLHSLIPENALVGALYYPIEYSDRSQQIMKYATYFGVPAHPRLPHPTNHRFENVYWKNWSMCSEAYMNNYMFRGCPNVKFANMLVDKLPSGHYTIQNMRKRKLYITKHNEGWAWGTLSKDPGPQGHLNFIPMKSGSFLISTEQWPNFFMYMESSASGYIRSWEGNPGGHGLWKIL